MQLPLLICCLIKNISVNLHISSLQQCSGEPERRKWNWPQRMNAPKITHIRIEIRQNIRWSHAFLVTETFWLLLQAIKMPSYVKGLLWPTDFITFGIALYDFIQLLPKDIGGIASGLPLKRIWGAALSIVNRSLQWESDRSVVNHTIIFLHRIVVSVFFLRADSEKLRNNSPENHPAILILQLPALLLPGGIHDPGIFTLDENRKSHKVRTLRKT